MFHLEIDKGFLNKIPEMQKDHIQYLDSKMSQIPRYQAPNHVFNKTQPYQREDNENILISERGPLVERNSITNDPNSVSKNFFTQRARSVDVMSKKSSIPKIMNQNVAAILDKYKLLDRTHTLTEPSEDRSLYESNIQSIHKNLINNQNCNVSFSNPELATQFTSLMETSNNKNFSTVKTNTSETNQTQTGTLNTLSNFESYNKKRESYPLRPTANEKNTYPNEDQSMHGFERTSLTSRQLFEKENLRKAESTLFNSMKLSDSKAPINAVSEAMKALQDRVKVYEEESNLLKRELEGMRSIQHNFAEEQKIKFLNEQTALTQKMTSIEKQNIEFSHECSVLKDQLTKIQTMNSKLESESTVLKLQNQKMKEELTSLSQNHTLLQKEFDIQEKEKNRHLEQNANDRDLFETKIDELMTQLENERKKNTNLQNEAKLIAQTKQDYEHEIKKLVSEQNNLEKRHKESLLDLETKTEKLIKERISYLDEINLLKNQLQEMNMLKTTTERDKGTLQRRISEFEKNIQTYSSEYEEKIESLRSELKEIKKENKSLKNETEKLRKSNVVLTEARVTAERECSEFQEIIKFLMEFNDELIGRLKKDPMNPDFKNVWYKKKKIDAEVQKFKEKKESEKQSKKTRSKSRSPLKKTKSRSSLGLDDEIKKEKNHLSDSKYFLTNPNDTPSSTAEKPKKSASTKKLLITTVDKKTQNMFDSFQANSDNKLDEFQSASKMTYFTPALNLQGSSRFGSSSRNPFQDENFRGEESNSFLNMFQSRALNGMDIERMNEDEISREIVKCERELTELRREQKNIQSKTQLYSGENSSELQVRLNQITLDIETKNEILKALKRKQRELISKDM